MVPRKGHFGFPSNLGTTDRRGLTVYLVKVRSKQTATVSVDHGPNHYSDFQFGPYYLAFLEEEGGRVFIGK